MAEYDIGVCCFFLNSEKFLPFSVRSFMESSAVKSIILVEGCVENYPRQGVSRQGLSKDGSSEIARELAKESSKVEHVPVGFVKTKKDLQNRGFHVIRSRLGEAAIYMLAGADEVYHPQELVNLQECFKENPKAKQVVYPFFHFWWRPDLVATGSSWSVLMHRAYRRPGLPMVFAHHAAPPADCGKGPKVHARKGNDYVCRCFHYVGMQDAPHIEAKLQLYRKRDGHRLKVTDTWRDWEWGQRTQWTHDGGSVRRFDGKHPSVIEKHVWNLTPRGADGKLLPLPEVPWDKDDSAHIISPKKDIAVFIEGSSLPDNSYVMGLVSYLQEHHNLTVYTLDGILRDGGYQVRKFKAHAINKHHVVILFPETFVIRPLGAKHVAVLWKDLGGEVDFTGYTVFKTSDVRGNYPELPDTYEFVKKILAAPTITTGRRPSRPAARAEILPDSSDFITPGWSGRHGPASRSFPVKIVNVTGIEWKKETHYIGAFWGTYQGKIIGNAPRTKRRIPKDIKPGETLVCDVIHPDVPRDMENGFLTLFVDVLDQAQGQWLNVGTKTPRQIRDRKIFR